MFSIILFFYCNAGYNISVKVLFNVLSLLGGIEIEFTEFNFLGIEEFFNEMKLKLKMKKYDIDPLDCEERDYLKAAKIFREKGRKGVA